MIKRVISIFLVVSTFLCLYGCKKEEDKNIVITVGYKIDKRTCDEHIKTFEKEHPGVKIITVDWTYDPNTFVTMAENGTLPGIYDTHFTEAKKLIDEGYAADITEEMREYNLTNRINDFILENISRNGKVYFVPRSIYSMGLYINVPLFKEAGLVDSSGIPLIPDTFEDVRNYAKIIKEKTGKYGFVFPNMSRYGGWFFTELAWNYGVSFMEQINGKWTATFDNDACVEALKLIHDMKWVDNTIQDYNQVGNNEVFQIIGNGEGAMTFAQSVQLDNAVKNGSIETKDIGLAKIPSGPAGRVSMVGGGYYAINPEYTGEKKKLAFEWLMFDKGYSISTEKEKEVLENIYKNKAEFNEGVIGITGIKIWNDSAANYMFEKELIDKYCNVNSDYVASFNNANDVVYRLEDPICMQALYEILDDCICRVLEDKNIDCKEIIAEANQKFQTDYLDYAD